MAEAFSITSGNNLTCRVSGGVIDKRNQPITLREKSFPLLPNTEYYISVDWRCEAIVCLTTPPEKKNKPLFRVKTGPASIVEAEDMRATVRLAAHTEYGTYADWILDGSTNEDVDWTKVDLLGVAPASATGVLLYVRATDSGVPTNQVGISFRKPGETAPAQLETIYPQVSGLWVSAVIPVGLDMGTEFEYSIKASGAFYFKAAVRGWIYGEA